MTIDFLTQGRVKAPWLKAMGLGCTPPVEDDTNKSKTMSDANDVSWFGSWGEDEEQNTKSVSALPGSENGSKESKNVASSSGQNCNSVSMPIVTSGGKIKK